MPSVELPTAQDVRDRLESMVAPLREQDKLVTSEIESIEARLNELRVVRTDLRRAIRSITGEPATNMNGQPRKVPGQKRSRGGNEVSSEALDKIYDWLVEHEAEYPDGFVGTQLAKLPDPPASSQSRIAKALKALHEQGRIVLDRVGVGKAKIYKLPPNP